MKTATESTPVATKSTQPTPQVFKPIPDKGYVTNSIGMNLVKIPAGKFVMGSPASEKNHFRSETLHEVEITRPFWMGVYEVTQEEYEKVLGKNPSWFSAAGFGKAKVAELDTRRFPVEKVSWEGAMEFCRKLSDLEEEKKAGRIYRLPTEAQWEYACRAGTTTVFHYGNSLASSQANFDGSVFPYGEAEKGVFLRRPTPVGSYRPNSFGLYDMHGNVWEWCTDWYASDYYETSTKQEPENNKVSSSRVIRGGSWRDAGWECRSAHRSRSEPSSRNGHFGFRVVVVQAKP